MKSLCVSILKTSQPAAPLFLLRKGKDVVINKSIVLEAFTDSKHVIKEFGSLDLHVVSSVPLSSFRTGDGHYYGVVPISETSG